MELTDCARLITRAAAANIELVPVKALEAATTEIESVRSPKLPLSAFSSCFMAQWAIDRVLLECSEA